MFVSTGYVFNVGTTPTVKGQLLYALTTPVLLVLRQASAELIKHASTMSVLVAAKMLIVPMARPVIQAFAQSRHAQQMETVKLFKEDQAYASTGLASRNIAIIPLIALLERPVLIISVILLGEVARQ